jgi:hypothetical protein
MVHALLSEYMHGNIAACFSVNMHGIHEKSFALLIGKYSNFGSECLNEKVTST